MIIWILFLSIVLFLFYRFYWQPKQIQKHYVEAFKKAGYRVLETPYQPFGVSTMKYIDFKKKDKDAMKRAKEVFSQYDVAVMNIFNSVEI